MKVVLIISSSIDVTTDYIIKEYSNEADFYRINVDEFSKYRIDIGGCCQWIISCDEWKLEKASVDSIYYRKPILPDLSEYDPNYHGMISKDIISLINGIADDFEGKVLTRPCILRKTENKTFQLLYALRNGLIIPKSYIGNDKEAVAQCLNNGKSIIKPLTTGKVKKCDGIELFQTNYICEIQNDISLTPLYVQSYQEKKYEVRVTCINDSIFAVRIDSEDKLDWRKNYAGIHYSIIDCPIEVKNCCLNMMRDLGLIFGAFDFIVNLNDEWVFLEVNPNGQWLWLEQILNISISRGIVQYLIS